MNGEDFDWIGRAIKKTEIDLKKLGANKKTIDRFFEGAQVIDCSQCNTYNLCEVESYEKTLELFKKKKVNLKPYGKNFEIFYCNNCEEYAIRYKDKK